MKFEYSSVLWPWSGFLALFITVLPEAAAVDDIASGEVSFTIVSPPAPGSAAVRRSSVTVPLTVRIAPTPPRWVLQTACLLLAMAWHALYYTGCKRIDKLFLTHSAQLLRQAVSLCDDVTRSNHKRFVGCTTHAVFSSCVVIAGSMQCTRCKVATRLLPRQLTYVFMRQD